MSYSIFCTYFALFKENDGHKTHWHRHDDDLDIFYIMREMQGSKCHSFQITKQCFMSTQNEESLNHNNNTSQFHFKIVHGRTYITFLNIEQTIKYVILL